ncbi:MAG: hypothetical protein ACJATV_000452 [Granulosicoccus sp.]|jgi:hypothetical protein
MNNRCSYYHCGVRIGRVYRNLGGLHLSLSRCLNSDFGQSSAQYVKDFGVFRSLASSSVNACVRF